MTVAILIGVFFISFLIGVPVSLAIGLASFLTIVQAVPMDMAVFILAQKMFTGSGSFALLAIPCFILAGNMMAECGMAGHLINMARLVVGRWPGALFQVNIVGNAFFAAVSGSAVASAAAIGGIVGEEQRKDNYDMDLAAAVNIASCPVGLLTPPSNTLIIFSLVSGSVSVSALFMAGYLPSFLMTAICMIVANVIARKDPNMNKPSDYKVSGLEKRRILVNAIPLSILLVGVIVGIIAGVFTATEGAAIAIAYVYVVGALILKTLKMSHFKAIMLRTLASSCMVLFLIACSAMLSWVIAFFQIPQQMSNALLSITSNKYVLILLINIMLLIVGTFMDMAPAILIFTPLLLPIVENIGMHPVHFGMMMSFNLAIGICTPPVGNALFVGCSIGKRPIEKVIPKLIPFILVLIVGLMIVSYVPALSLTFPRLLGLI